MKNKMLIWSVFPPNMANILRNKSDANQSKQEESFLLACSGFVLILC